MTALILASGSESRRRILSDAGVPFRVQKPGTNEAAIKAALSRTHATPMAIALAEDKARSVSRQHRGDLVLGADQILVCEGRLYDKVPNVAAAREVLLALRGKEHSLVTAAVLARDDMIVWRHVETPRLWMRDFSDAFLDAYLVDHTVDILSSVGCYHVEGFGPQLFGRIEGDHFTIRGLPLIPLLQALREHGVLQS